MASVRRALVQTVARPSGSLFLNPAVRPSFSSRLLASSSSSFSVFSPFLCTKLSFPCAVQQRFSGESSAQAETSTQQNGSQQATQSTPSDPTTAKIKDLEHQVIDLESKIAELQTSLEEWKNHAKLFAADADNARKIAKKDVEAAKDYSLNKFSKDLLEVVDVLTKALEIAKKSQLDQKEDSKTFYEGICSTSNVLTTVLGRHGVSLQEVKAGELFNPNLHEAIALVPDTTKPHNTIIQVWQPGFMLNKRILRAAKVVVSDNQEDLQRQMEERKKADAAEEAKSEKKA